MLLLGSEALPFSKTGGLGDVLGALPLALGQLGWGVTVVTPRYRGIADGTLVDACPVTVGSYTGRVGFYEVPLADRVRAILVDVPELFDRPQLYGEGSVDYPDNPRRFAMLVRAALEFAGRQPSPPSVVHAHDWQTGLTPASLRTRYATHPTLASMPTVFTIHNLAYQGLFEPDWLPRLDLPWELFGIEEMEFWGRISFLKAGINGADAITTVSPSYASEIQTPELGFGFDGILRRRGADVAGILNGIDTNVWDPSRDGFLPVSFSSADLSGKRDAKGQVLRRYGLSQDAVAMQRPLVGMISRMVDQKGFDLIATIAEELPTLDASFVLLGTGDAKYEELWRRLASRHPDRIGAHIGFREELAHLIEGGADVFLMPSRFEPCGLNQMYSLRYGTVPIVRAVGGLADTIRDYKPPTTSTAFRPQPNGFVFTECSGEALLGTLKRALATFSDQVAWRTLQLSGMAEDHSWHRSAAEYVKIYDAVAAKRNREGPQARQRPEARN